MKRLLPSLLVLTLALAAVVQAQSLADVARKEQQRRKEIARPAKLYTNKDLGQVEPAPAAPASSAAGAPGSPAPAAGEAVAKPADGPPEPTDEEKRAADEAMWRGRMAEARSQLERSKMFAEALQTRVNSLWADFTARDDPMQRAQLESERKKTLAELERINGEIETQTKGLADLEEEARRAGVPPGWLR